MFFQLITEIMHAQFAATSDKRQQPLGGAFAIARAPALDPLARIIHKLSTAAASSSVLTTFRSVDLFDELHESD